MILIIALGFVMAVVYSIAEVCHERDWPRHMGKYAGIFAALLVAAVVVFE